MLINKNERMHSNSNGITGFIGELDFLNNFGRNVVLTLHYQLSFLQNDRFPGKMNRTQAQRDLESLPSVLEV